MALHPNVNLDRKWPLFALVMILLYLKSTSIVQAAAVQNDQGLVSFVSKCNCSLTMACTCCQSAVINAMNLTKTACVTFKINLLKASVDVTLSLDGNTVSTFTLDAKAPVSFCLPVISDMTPLSLCIKMNTKMSGLTNLNICPSFLSNLDANQILAYEFPCIKLGLDGFSIV